MKLGEVIASQKRDDKLLSPEFLAHVSPLCIDHARTPLSAWKPGKWNRISNVATFC